MACTCSKSGDDILSGFNFRMVIVDEASQCTEPSILVPLSKGVECLILAGDPQQLPPTVISQEGVQAGLMITLFDRFIQRGMLLTTCCGLGLINYSIFHVRFSDKSLW